MSKKNEHDSVHNKGDYAFSKHLHLHQTLAQRLLAQSQAAGMSITQVIYKVLDENLPQVHVRPIHTKPAEPALPGGVATAASNLSKAVKKASLTEQEQSTVRRRAAFAPIRLPDAPGNVQDLSTRVVHFLANNTAEEIVTLAVVKARTYPVGESFTLPDLFEPFAWEDFPREIRRPARKAFLKALTEGTVRGQDVPQFRRVQITPISRYVRVR